MLAALPPYTDLWPLVMPATSSFSEGQSPNGAFFDIISLEVLIPAPWFLIPAPSILSLNEEQVSSSASEKDQPKVNHISEGSP